MKFFKKAAAGALALCVSLTAAAASGFDISQTSAATDTVSMEWGSVEIGGGGFVSGIITGQSAMYARTDVGGAYRYNYETDEWEQLLAFINEEDRGFLSVDALAIDPTDDDTIYMLCGSAYLSDARTAIFKSTDGGESFTEYDVTDLIQVHGNGDGRQCGEAIAVDPDNPDIIYCGGDVASGDSALIWSQDGGETWEPVMGYDDLGYFSSTTLWPTWTDHSVKSIDDGAYNTQNGVATIAIEDGKVYVGTSITGVANVVVADVGSDDFEPLCSDLPTEYYPSRINKDTQGNLFITYIAGLAFNGSSGGAYKYNIATGELTDFTEGDNALPANGFGAVTADVNNPDHLVATTCGLWYSQMWQEWSDEQGPAWGDRFFKSEDGGETWVSMTPGNTKGWGQPLEAEYLQDGGRSWIQNKAIHWVGAIVIDPTDSDRIFVTSGNGVFACDNTWDETPAFYFHPDGIEEVVSLDLTSVPGGAVYSAIGDYDGFIHTDVEVTGEQYQPNMGSTSAIAYCPQNPDVMVRYAENQNDTANGFYSLDGGETWTEMNCSTGGKAAITQLEDGTYRFFQSSGSDGSVKYSDDFGETWSSCTGIPSVYGSKTTYMLVEPDMPNVVYAYATYYNSSWYYSKSEADISDACYKFCISTDYGQTFTSIDICMYDQCDSAGRIAYLGEDNIILGAGWYGLYNVTDGGKTVTKKDVYYCKTVGYGAPEEEGGLNTLYMYGMPTESDPEGIYRSTDGGDTWVCINSDKLYGGTGNGNFLVGDMNEFGTVYMSTLGCGIIYGRLASDDDQQDDTTSTTESDILWGDADCSGTVTISDSVAILSYITNNEKYPLTEQGLLNADVYFNGDGLSNMDALAVQKLLSGVLSELPESYNNS
ncbi:MAG: 1,4-beta-glucanase [Ruminococcus sp.]|nr:1,4-beta-glucanase [Ruminococcus sp.]